MIGVENGKVKMNKYRVISTPEKVYIETPQGCVARLCELSAEFDNMKTVIYDCSFKTFQNEAYKRGYEVSDKHKPVWAR
jgi:hypothetical protein